MLKSNRLFATASILAFATCVTPAAAQGTDAVAADEIVVTGFRGSVAQSIDAKRDLALAEAMEIGMNDVGLIPTHYQLNTWASRKGIKVQARTDEYTLATGIRKE